MNPEIYDNGDGICLEFPFENALAIRIYMEDEAAQQMIDIIQNKLNARLL